MVKKIMVQTNKNGTPIRREATPTELTEIEAVNPHYKAVKALSSATTLQEEVDIIKEYLGLQ